jgi:glycosyltransferase involved in cell wall biosynthesis
MLTPKVKVCVVRHGYFPQDPRVRKEVCALREENYQVDVVCLRDHAEPAFEVWQGARVHRLPLRHERRGALNYLFEYLHFFIRALFTISKLHLQQRYDLVQVHNMPDFLVFVALVPRVLGAKVILDMHELMPEFFASQFKWRGASLWMRLVALVEKASVLFAHRVMVVSPLDAATLSKRVRKNLVIVHNVPDETLFAQPQKSSSSEAAPNILITHGTILERYGIQVLLEALPSILKEIPVKVYVIGDGEFLDELKKRANTLDVEKHIVFTGKIPLEDVARYILDATLGIVSLLEDGFIETASPNKLFEYIALGKPVIASDIPGIRVYFNESQIQYVRPGDAQDLAHKTIALLKDPAQRAELVSRAYAVYETIRWTQTKLVYQKMIRELIQPENRRSHHASALP